MASLEIAAKANLALVLPTLLMATFLERNAFLTSLTKTYQESKTLSGSGVVRFTLEDGTTLADNAINQYFSELVASKDSSQPRSPITEWIRRSADFSSLDYKFLRTPLDELDNHLVLRTLLCGYSLSLADLAVWGAIRGNPIAHSTIKKIANNTQRWYNFVESSNPWIQATTAEGNSSATKERAAASAAGASYDIDLPDIKGPLITRFPPEPSGYLHIGHAKAALLNDYFAHKKEGGTLICRFDDTNPSKESMEFQDAILHDLKLMEIFPDKTSYSSDYFQEMYDYAIKLIKDGKAFADDSELGKGDEDRKNRLPSKRRDLSIEDTLKYFEEMKTDSEEGRRWCLRARIAYDSPNGTLRDPVIYRCNQIPHHRTGSKWKIYPTYDFCAPILDSVEGVNVALRTNEYRDRNVQYEWMQDALGLRKVVIWDFSRMNFVRTLLSKRKLTKIVDEGRVSGWDDPRMPTIRGILRRGMTVQALREFVLKQGPSRNITNLEWGAFWALNKKYIDPIAPRHTAVNQDHAVYCHVIGVDGPTVVSKPKHVKNPEVGMKQVMYDQTVIIDQADAQTFESNEEITLMNWGNAYVRNISKEGNEVTKVDLELHLEGDFKKTKKKITWLAVASTNKVPVDLYSFDYLITKDKLEKDDELEKCLTAVTEFRTQAFADCNVAELAKGAIIQFERKGYYKLDVPYQGDGSRMVFFDIPSGKS